MGNFKKERITNCANFNENVDTYGHRKTQLVETFTITTETQALTMNYNLLKKYGMGVYVIDIHFESAYTTTLFYLNKNETYIGLLGNGQYIITLSTNATVINLDDIGIDNATLNIYKINI